MNGDSIPVYLRVGGPHRYVTEDPCTTVALTKDKNKDKDEGWDFVTNISLSFNSLRGLHCDDIAVLREPYMCLLYGTS